MQTLHVHISGVIRRFALIVVSFGIQLSMDGLDFWCYAALCLHLFFSRLLCLSPPRRLVSGKSFIRFRPVYFSLALLKYCFSLVEIFRLHSKSGHIRTFIEFVLMCEQILGIFATMEVHANYDRRREFRRQLLEFWLGQNMPIKNARTSSSSLCRRNVVPIEFGPHANAVISTDLAGNKTAMERTSETTKPVHVKHMQCILHAHSTLGT